MTKKVFTATVICLMSMSTHAQVYPEDSWARFSTPNLYDPGLMNMYLRALSETAELREKNFHHYSDLAVDAFVNSQWNLVIYYVNEALDTKYYNGDLYFLRGYAYEQIGKTSAAKRDYKKGARYGCEQAANALEELKERNRKK